MFDPVQFLKPYYLFEVSPSPQFQSYWICLSFFFFLLLLAIVIFVFIRVKKVNPPLKRILKPLPMRFEIFAGVGILLVLFRLSGAYYLSMRFFLLVWLIVFIWYLFLLSKKIKQYPSRFQEYIQKEESRKYYTAAPKGKKKRKKSK